MPASQLSFFVRSMKTVRIIYAIITIFLFLPEPGLCAGHISTREGVILLHGLARTKHSMSKMEKRLKAEGYEVINRGYPSRHLTIEKLAEDAIPAAIEACRKKGATRIHFVTHSMGGILVRYYLKHHEIQVLGRVVMLSPPNGGSEVVDTFKNTYPFRFINGPAGKQLGTDASSLPRRLGKVTFDTGVITGDRSINIINSLLIPGADDGKVSVINAKVEGMSDFLIVHVSHPFIMKNDEVIKQTVYFLKNGKFDRHEEHRKE
jgi:triacylglycerol lipase